MTRLRPLVIPAAAIALATAAPSAAAQQRRPVDLSNPWAASQPASLVAEHADGILRAAAVQPAKSLPFAALDSHGEATIPDGRPAVPQPPADVAAAGRPTLPFARGPP